MTEMDSKALTCHLCNENFQEEVLLGLHLLSHSREETVTETAAFVNSQEVSYFEIECCEDVSNPRPFVCSVCGRGFGRKEHLEKHAATHSGEKPFVCLTCGKCFSRKDRLKDHHTIHLQKGWACYFCGRMFAQRCIQRKHEQTHRGVKEFGCEHCGHRFSRRNDLQRHLAAAHSPDFTPFSCEQCPRRFTQKRLLQRHLRIHK